jgi:hypothetical protein
MLNPFNIPTTSITSNGSSGLTLPLSHINGTGVFSSLGYNPYNPYNTTQHATTVVVDTVENTHIKIRNKIKKLITDIFTVNKDIIKLQEFLNYYDIYEIKLVGGAVIDIIENRKPKDFDCLHGANVFNKLHYISNSNYSKTLIYKGLKIQFLKQEYTNNFDFTVAQNTVTIRKNAVEVVYQDLDSLLYKKLVPVSYEDQKMVLQSLSRIPHWQKKGYTIDELTYSSLLNTLRKNIVTKS